MRDTTPPRVYASVPADEATLSGAVGAIVLSLVDDTSTIDTTASCNGATVRDGDNAAVTGAWSAEHNNLIFTPALPLGAGSYTVTIHPTDASLGNAATAVVVFGVDVVAPAAPVVNTLPAATNVSSFPLSGTKEAGTSIWLDGAPVVALDGSTTWTYPLTLHEGANAHILSARDGAGNRSPEVRFGIVLDSYRPVLVGVAPVAGSYMNVRPGYVTLSYRAEGSALDAAATLATAVIRNSSNQIVPGSWSLPTANVVTFTPTEGFAEDTYTVSLTAGDLAGNSRPTNLSFTYDATAPPAPTLDPVTSPTNFAVQTLSGTKSSNSCIWINGVQAVSTNAETTWSYEHRLVIGMNMLVVVARDPAGNTSGEVNATIEYNDTAPLPVSNLWAGGDGFGTAVTLFWWGYDELGQGDVAQYRVYILDHPFSQVSGLTPTATVAAGQYSYFATGLSKGATYWCAVVAVDTQGNALTTVNPIQTVPRDIIAPEDANNLLVQSLDRRLVFSWSPSADTQGDLSGYKVYFNTDAAVPLPKTQLSFDRVDLAEGTAYPCRVVSVDGDGNESGGVNLVGVTLMPNPANVAVQPWSGYATVTWSPVSPTQYLKQYAVYASPTPFTSVDSLTPRATTTSTTANVAGLTNNTLYYFAVTAVNISDGERKTVTTVSATPVTDTTGPILNNVSFDGSPLANGAVLTRTGTVTLDAIDGSGVARVEFAVDGVLRYTGYSAPYAFTWSVAASADGPHTLAVTASDTLGYSTALSRSVTVALAPPPAPSITNPASGLVTSASSINVVGAALRDTTITLTVNGQAAGNTVATAAGAFNLVAALNEGANLLQVVASNRAGAGPPSSTVLVMRDSTIPSPPTQLTALPKPARAVRLSWSAPTGATAHGYHMYRAATPFTDTAAATRVNVATVTGTIFDDAPPVDGACYYRAVSVNAAGTVSALSEQASAAADGALPKAVSIAYTPTIFDPGTGRAGPGVVPVLLTVNEPLLTTPFLSLTPQGGLPQNINLAQQTPTTYSGSFTITAATGCGTLAAVFSARDTAGNRGTAIDVGATLLIDTCGPSLREIALDPSAPILNDSADPVTVTATLTLDDALPSGGVPQVSYQLSGPGRVPVALSPTHLAGSAWRVSFTLPSDAGASAPENLSFGYQAADDLGNVGAGIQCPNSFQIYQNTLPPLGVPGGFVATALPGGAIRLAWQDIPGASGYQLYRQAPGEGALTPYARTAAVHDSHDQPAVQGAYTYAVASVRAANGQESLSDMSLPATATSDSVSPPSPIELVVAIEGSGARAQWTAPYATDPITYRLYRSAAPIVATIGLTPLLADLAITTALDSRPSLTEYWYAVTAADQAGNESPPSINAYLNVQLLPVRTLEVSQSGDAFPVLSWTHAAADLAGCNVYLRDPQTGADLKVNTAPIAGSGYTDTGYRDNERRYAVSAVDAQAHESEKRLLVLPRLRATLVSGASIRRGLFNRVDYAVRNDSAARVEHVRLAATLAGAAYETPEFGVDPGAAVTQSLLVGGSRSLPATADLATTLDIEPETGEQVRILRSQQVAIGDGGLGLELRNETFTRGGTGRVSFVLTNSGSEEIDIVVAKASGAAASNEISWQLQDADGNVLSSLSFKQVNGGAITLAGGEVIARLPAGGSFTSGTTDLAVPLSAPLNVRIKLEIAKIHHHLGQADHAVMDGPSAIRDITLVDTPYFGEVTAVAPAVVNGSQPVTITGRAVDRATTQPLPNVPLKLLVAVSGFYREYSLTTGLDGAFTYQFKPNTGESGQYTVAAIHPFLQDRPVQMAFTINRLSATPAAITVSIPKNYEKRIDLQIESGPSTTARNVRLVFEPQDQPAGILPAGVHVVPGAAIALLGTEQHGTLSFTIWGDNSAAAADALVLLVKSDEVGTGAWERIAVATSFSAALPALSATPSFVEAGLALGSIATESLTLKNLGSLEVGGVKVALVNADGSAAPSWVSLSSAADLGTVAPGATREVSVSFRPQSPTVSEGSYSWYLRVTGTNYQTSDVPIHAMVTQSGVGGALFQVADIYTGTRGPDNSEIRGVSGARVTVQNELVIAITQSLTTDSLGEALFTDLPAGAYRVRVTAAAHNDYTGRVVVKPGIVVSESVFIERPLVAITWEVVETTIPDVYTYQMNVTYETDVPAAVLVIDPSSYTLPSGMTVGSSYSKTYTVTNHGLIGAEDVQIILPQSPGWDVTALSGTPSTLGPGESFTFAVNMAPTAGGSGSSSSSSGSGSAYGDVGSGDSGLGDTGSGATGSEPGCVDVNYKYTCEYGNSIVGNAFSCPASGIIPTEIGSYWERGPEAVLITGSICLPSENRDSNSEENLIPNGGMCPTENEPNPPTADSSSPMVDPPSNENNEQLAASNIDLLHGRYEDDETDLIVAVPGGEIPVTRIYRDFSWQWQIAGIDIPRQRLVINSVGEGEERVIQSIAKDGVEYAPNGNPGEFTYKRFKITTVPPEEPPVTITAFRWDAPDGQSRIYDANGRMESFWKSNVLLGGIDYASDDPGLPAYFQVVGIRSSQVILPNDPNGVKVQVLWFTYREDGKLVEVRTAATGPGPRVQYDYVTLSSVNLPGLPIDMDKTLLQTVRVFHGSEESEYYEMVYGYTSTGQVGGLGYKSAFQNPGHPAVTFENADFQITYSPVTGYVSSFMDRFGNGQQFSYEVLAETTPDPYYYTYGGSCTDMFSPGYPSGAFCPISPNASGTNNPVSNTYDDQHTREIHVVVKRLQNGLCGQIWETKQVWYHLGGTTKKVVLDDRLVKEVKTIDWNGSYYSVETDDQNNVTVYRYEKSYETRGNLQSVRYSDTENTTIDFTYGIHDRLSSRTVSALGDNAVVPVSQDIYNQDSNGNVIEKKEGCKGSGADCLRITSYSDFNYGQPGKSEVSGPNCDDVARTFYTYYPNNGRVETMIDPLNQTTTFSDYDVRGLAEKVKNQREEEWVYHYDYLGRLKTVRRPGEQTDFMTLGYTPRNDPSQRTIKLDGATVTFSTAFTYDDSTVPKIAEANEPEYVGTWRTEYNSNGSIRRRIDPTGVETVYQYRPNKQLSKIYKVDLNGDEIDAVTFEYFDQNPNRGDSKSVDSNLWRVVYPTFIEEYDYKDAMQRVTLIKKLDRKVPPNTLEIVTYAYDLDTATGERSVTITSGDVPIIDGERRKERVLFDRLGRVKQKDFKDSNDVTVASESFTYDCRGNLIRTNDRKGNISRYAYDLKDRLTKEYRPSEVDQTNGEPKSTAVVSKQYVYSDPANKNSPRTVTITDKENRVIVVTFDALGRIVKEVSSRDEETVETIEYTYNELGSIKTVTKDNVIQLEMTWDKRQRKLTEKMHIPGLIPAFTKTYRYTYLANGLKKSFIGEDGITYNYVYDSGRGNRLASIEFPGAEAKQTINYHPENYTWLRPTNILLPGTGIEKKYTYDALMRQASSAALRADDKVVDISYQGYSTAGNLKGKTIDSVGLSYVYDTLNRLKTVNSGIDSQDEWFFYDTAGNRKPADEASAATWAVNSNNELTRMTFPGDSGTTDYTYDAVGNLETMIDHQRQVSFRYSYDNRNNLVKAEKLGYPSGDATETTDYGYDAFNRRISKKSSVEGSVTYNYYQYSDDGLIAEYDATGTEIKTYGWEPNSVWGTNPLFQKVGNQYYWYINDHLGTPQKMIDGTGAVVWAADYAAFGKATVTTGTVTNNLRFPGQYYDAETGLHYNWNRYYDPQLGRYLSPDPIGIAGGLNLYAYVDGNPLRWFDPFGFVPVDYGDYTKDGGSKSWRTNNPGNLIYGPRAQRFGAIGKYSSGPGAPMAVFPSVLAGVSAQIDLLNSAYGNMAVKDMLPIYAPPSENNTAAYLKFLQDNGIDPNKTVGEQLEQLQALMQRYEGWKEGTCTPKPTSPSPTPGQTQ